MTKTILIADDEELIVDSLATLLEDEHYRVLRAYDGEQALAAARRERPEPIITDIMMPRMSGTELAAQEPSETTPIVLMSAVRSLVTVPNTIYLPKPFDIDRVSGRRPRVVVALRRPRARRRTCWSGARGGAPIPARSRRVPDATDRARRGR
jgi:DNA-binding response OmpR family regulator